ncbi:leucine-rich repeat-containing protein 56-like [Amphiura filiformis]|uniref:leucine-rich repeat-containing protein 56-like n=1 Tax=Amphiura filiformis TaxID=82378 RepID=UPI003B21210F
MAAAFEEDVSGATSVHITEFGDIRVNPQPIVQEEDTDVLLEEYLSPRKLKEMTGVDDLEDIKFLEMRVDTTETSLGNFGSMVPNLKQLKLNGSVIATVRDLGTSLDNLKVLWMARCCLCDLDGISSMSSLQELYLAYNDIADISPVSMLDNLQLLDLEGNNIEEVSQVEFLALCSKLTTLTLEGNPLCLAPTPDYNKEEEGDFDYRASVRKAIPHLKILDDDPMAIMPSSLGEGIINRSTDWLIVNEAIKETTGSSDSLDMEGGRPGSASRRRPGSARPGTAANRPVTSLGNRPGTSMGNRPGTSAGQRPDTAGSDIQSVGEDCRDLTYGRGGVMCGNPVRALRSRRKKQDSYDLPQGLPSLFVAFQHQPEHTYYTEDEEGQDASKEDIFAELRAWKEEHERKVSVREKQREPQILTIIHDEDDNNNEDTLMDYEDDLGIHSVTPPAASPDSAEFGRMPSPPGRLGDMPSPPGRLGSPKGPMQSHNRHVRPKTAGAELSFRTRRYRQKSMDDILVDNMHQMRISQDDDTLTGDSGHSSPNVLPYSPPPFRDDRPFSGPVTVNRNHTRSQDDDTLTGDSGHSSPNVLPYSPPPFRDDRPFSGPVTDQLLSIEITQGKRSQDDDSLTGDSGYSSPNVLPYSPPPFRDDRPFSGPVTVNRNHTRKEPAMIKSQPKIIDRQNPVVRSSTHTPPGLAQRLPGLLRPVTAKAALQRQPLSLSRQPKT